MDKIPSKAQLPQVLRLLRANHHETDIPLSGDKSLPFRPGLPLKQLNALFARCHNAIRKIEKDEDNAFADFSKFLFLKLLEEKADEDGFSLPYSYRFHELANKSESEHDQVKTAILAMIQQIRAQTPYGEVLEDDIRLRKADTFHYIVSALAQVSFQDSSLDTKGAAFEYFVRATLKGKKLGQYFTPRPLIIFMCSLIGENKIINAILTGQAIKVLDPACGTGGFLVYLLNRNLALLADRLRHRIITDNTYNSVAIVLRRQAFFGSDANHAVACAAKMNLIIAGDGFTNIEAEDSLKKDARNWNVDRPDCDIILTNPPFGTSEAASLTPEDMEQYPFQTKKGQLVFLQKMVLAASKGGEICTVIDEGVLNTDTAIELRKWLLQNCQLCAVVRLPEETFKPNNINVRASVLYLKRHYTEDPDFDEHYNITFCDLMSLGYTGAGDHIRGFDLDTLISEVESKIFDADAESSRSGYYWRAFDVNVQDIVSEGSFRLDLKYWEPTLRAEIEAIQKAGGQLIKQINTVDTSRGKSPEVDAYVDESDGYALVVKAGSNISKYGELITEGDFIEKGVYDEYEIEESRETKKKRKNVVIRDGDILLASTGDGTLGKCCVYRDLRPAVADSHVTIIRVDQNRVWPEYLCDYLRAGPGAEQIQRLYTGSTGLIELTPQQVDSVVVEIPKSLEEQKVISSALREVESQYQKTVQDAASKLAEARARFRSKPSRLF